MKLSMAAATVAVMASMAACDGPKVPAEAPPAAPPAEAAAPANPTPTPAAAAPVESAAVPGAPAFAAVYPGAEIEGEPTLAGGPAGPGGAVTFLTEAEPEEVVAFYRERADQAGLAPVMEMNQGDARGYSAAKESSGASVQVVASPTEDKDTSVQLMWSEGAGTEGQ